MSNTLTLKDGGVLRGGGVVRPGTIVSNSDGYLDGAGLEASSLTTDPTGVHGAWLDITKMRVHAERAIAGPRRARSWQHAAVEWTVRLARLRR